MVARDVRDGTMVDVTAGATDGVVRLAAAPDAATSAWIGRGWFDVQVNGFAGHDVNTGDLDVAGFEDMTRALHARGVARYLPTVITASPAHLRACLGALHAATQASDRVAPRTSLPSMTDDQ